MGAWLYNHHRALGMNEPTVGSYEEAGSDERGAPVGAGGYGRMAVSVGAVEGRVSPPAPPP